MIRSCLSINDISDSDVSRLFFAAKKYKEEGFSKEHPRFSMITLFLEPSTRTRMSFQLAAFRLNGTCFDFDEEVSSVKKGESFQKTMENLVCLSPDLFVIRKSDTLDSTFLASLNVPVINAGDGINEHPTQALLDCFTLCEQFRTASLVGKKILFIGDLLRSRVFNSNVKLMKRMGANIAAVGPTSLSIDQTYPSFYAIDQKFDAVMVLRKQKERTSMSAQEAHAECLTEGHFKSHLGDDCLLLHPGPVMVGEDVESALLSHRRSLIFEQVRNGMFIRAALLRFSLGG